MEDSAEVEDLLLVGADPTSPELRGARVETVEIDPCFQQPVQTAEKKPRFPSVLQTASLYTVQIVLKRWATEAKTQEDLRDKVSGPKTVQVLIKIKPRLML